MTTIYTAIHAGLDAQLATTPNLPAFNNENSAIYRPTIGTPYCRATLLPAQPLVGELGVGGRTEFQGLYQVDLFYPINAGTTLAEAMVDAVLSVFPRGTVIMQAGINIQVKLAYRLVARSEPPWFIVPVSVSWWSFIAN